MPSQIGSVSEYGYDFDDESVVDNNEEEDILRDTDGDDAPLGGDDESSSSDSEVDDPPAAGADANPVPHDEPPLVVVHGGAGGGPAGGGGAGGGPAGGGGHGGHEGGALGDAGGGGPGGGGGHGGHGWGVGPAHGPYQRCRLPGGEGFILINEHPNAVSLDAHCAVCGCRVNKKFMAHRRLGARSSQGRPMGGLILWLQKGCTGNPVDHRRLWCADQLVWADRRHARAWGMAQAALAPAFAKERHAWDHEAEPEPERLP